MSHLPRKFVLYCLAAIVPVAGMLAATAVTANAQTTTAAVARPSASARAEALARAAIEKLAIGQHPVNHPVGVISPPGKPKGLTNVESTNWSGYADTGSSFSKVSANWTEPSATCSSRTEQLAAFWVGIDGYSSNSVEQDGTLIECYKRKAYQYTWWEMYPTNAIQVVGRDARRRRRDHFDRDAERYELHADRHRLDAHRNSFTETESCSSCENTSAEWIAEAPTGSSSIYPLADFGSWTASGASVTEGSTSGVISSFTDDEITMVNSSSRIKALPGALNSSGSSFPVTWERS